MEKIDIVIPWVDDQDANWLRKKNKYLTSSHERGEYTTKNRYRDYGTLRFVIRSIDKYMPWVNNVFLVTDNQRPEWIDTHFVKVIDHTQFIKGNLPTFNSDVIMTNLGNILELSEKFIVFNDETIVWNMTCPKDFFRNGLPVDSLIETSTVPKSDGFFHISANGVALINEKFSKRVLMKKHFNHFFNFKYGIQNLRTILSLPYGGFVGFYNQHLILPYSKNDFKRAYSLFPVTFRDTWGHRFRESSDVNEWFIRYIRNVTGNFQPGFINGQFLTIGDFKNGFPKVRKKSQVIVINDDSDGNIDEDVICRIKRFCLDKFPKKSKYEK